MRHGSALERLGIVPFDEQRHTYSVLLQPTTESIVRLPPRRLMETNSHITPASFSNAGGSQSSNRRRS